MAAFAKIENGKVTQVISVHNNEVLNDDGLEDEAIGVEYLKSIYGQDTEWKKTSYNTRGGIYYTPNTNTPDSDQSKAFRKNYAGIGSVYDPVKDAFYYENPTFPSWIFNEFSCQWEAPVVKPIGPGDTIWAWFEDVQAWVALPADDGFQYEFDPISKTFVRV